MPSILFLYNTYPIANTHKKLIVPSPFSNSPKNSLTPVCCSSSPKPNDTTTNTNVKSEPFFRPNKMPTAPWMKGPLVLEPNQVIDFTKSRKKGGNFSDEGGEKPHPSLTDRVRGGRGKKVMMKISKGIVKLQESHDSEAQKSPEQIKLDFLMIGGGVGGGFQENGDLGFVERMPWERDENVVFRRLKKEKVVTAAELSLDDVVLGRLRGEAAKIRKWIKVKKAGVNEGVVDQIRLIWRTNELVMLKFDIPLCRNMDRAREIVELKTGGLVVWCKKDALVVYRGSNYQSSPKAFLRTHTGNKVGLQVKSTEEQMIGRKEGEDETVSIDGSLYERETDRLLSGLGPRYIDWWRPKPLPVDADLLPEVVPGFKPPFRLCPPKTRAKLEDQELTYLRNFAHNFPTHFVLGRNRKLQGLAAAILKLWEKCHIAKIAVKLGTPNTNNGEMANELKDLTGGILLLRNKFIIIIYRGKDFLPRGVANLVADREMELKKCELQEEAARLKAVETICLTVEPSISTKNIGTLSEFQDIQSECGDLEDQNKEAKVHFEVEKGRLEKELRQQEHKLYILSTKIERAVKELEKLNAAWRLSDPDKDQEMLTPEERECFRRIGLKMDSSLVLGRRGVFDGVIEGLHQHWKHREVARVITKQRLFSQVVYTANLLQRESGGLLVSVEKLKEGHAIIFYCGKNYRRPTKLAPQNLLTKRQALQRSLEMQRVGSLKFFAYQRQKAISALKSRIAELRGKEIKAELGGKEIN